jgi:hypothetical protein
MPSPLPLVVTDSFDRDPAREARAKAAAARWGVPFVERPRHGKGLDPLFGTVAEAVLVLGGNGWTLHDAHGELRFSPGMATLRIKRLRAGVQQEDHLLRLGEVRAGDVLVDATLGLGADALVLSAAAGPTGRVIGLETSLPLSALVSEGLAAGLPFEAMAPIEVRCAEALMALRAMPTGSVDCVFFDPMFDRPKKSSAAFEMLRRYASLAPLTTEALEEAQRVARRWVVVKAGRYTRLFEELGLEHATASRYRPLVWARVKGRG